MIDTAPLIPVSDTLVLGDLADELFMVVRCNRTPSVITLEAIRKLQQAGVAVSGLVLNRLTQRTRGYDYYFYNSYHRTEQSEDVPLEPMGSSSGQRANPAPFYPVVSLFLSFVSVVKVRQVPGRVTGHLFVPRPTTKTQSLARLGSSLLMGGP